MQTPVAWHDLMSKLVDRLAVAGRKNPDGVRFLLSAHASHEEMFLFRRLAEELIGEGAIGVTWRVSPKTAAAGHEVRRAGRRRTERQRRQAVRPRPGRARRRRRRTRPGGAAGGRQRRSVSALYVFDPGPAGSLGDVRWILDARAAGKLPLLIVQGVLLTDLARAADFVLPGASYVEKEASYTNEQGRLQGTARAIPAPGEAMEDWQILVNLSAALGVTFEYTSPAHVRADIAAKIRRRLRRHHDAGVRQTDVGAPLAAGEQPVGAVEVGFHVSRPAARQRRRGSDRAPRDDSAAGSEIVRSFVPGLPRAAAAAAVIVVDLPCTAGYAQLRRPSPAELTPLLETDAVRAGTTARAALVIRLSEGLHTNSNKPRDPLLIPIVLSFQPPAGVSVTEVVYPAPTDLKQEGSAQPLAVFEREFKLGVQLAVAADVPPGELVVPASLRYQACDEKVCYPPVTLPASWTLRVVASNRGSQPRKRRRPEDHPVRHRRAAARCEASVPAVIAPGESSVASTPFTGTAGRIEDFSVTGTAAGYLGTADFLQFIRNAEAGIKEKGLFEDRGVLAILVLVLLGGLALNLTPCVLPMIPINLAIIGAGAQAGSRTRGFLLGATYGAAMALVYGALGLIVILTAGTFGAINASPWFNLGIAAAVRGARAGDVRRPGHRFLAVLDALQRRRRRQGHVPGGLRHGRALRRCWRAPASRRS